MFTKRFHTISFKHAADGLVNTFVNQPNLRVHLVIATIVIIIGLLLGITPQEWAIIVFTILWVIISEMINSAIEAVCDAVTTEYRQPVKQAKDVAAGMVLVGAIGSVVVGAIIFLPYFINIMI